jgi:hypothetical protein
MASGGTWAGCVYDPDRILAMIQAGQQAKKTIPLVPGP